jgi:hypothetical protein
VPVKNCSDLLLVKSDIYLQDNGRLVINENKMFTTTTPVIKLGDHFKNVSLSLSLFFLSQVKLALTNVVSPPHQIQEFQKRFKTVPHILDLDHLTVTGNVFFGSKVTMRGTVISKSLCRFIELTHPHVTSYCGRGSANRHPRRLCAGKQTRLGKLKHDREHHFLTSTDRLLTSEITPGTIGSLVISTSFALREWEKEGIAAVDVSMLHSLKNICIYL